MVPENKTPRVAVGPEQEPPQRGQQQQHKYQDNGILYSGTGCFLILSRGQTGWLWGCFAPGDKRGFAAG